MNTDFPFRGIWRVRGGALRQNYPRPYVVAACPIRHPYIPLFVNLAELTPVCIMALSLGCAVRRRQSQRNTTDQGFVLGGDHRRRYVHVCKDSMASQMVRAAGNTFRMRNTRFLRIAAYCRAEYATGVCDAFFTTLLLVVDVHIFI